MNSFRPAIVLDDILPSYSKFLGQEESPRPDYRQEVIHPVPTLVGHGPKEFSTSTALEQRKPYFAWDVNGYYRRLGIPFPYVNVPRSKLHRYFGDAHDDPLKLYAFAQLYNNSIREEYDRIPLGQIYLNDKYVQAELKKRALDEANRLSAQGGSITAEEVLSSWGLILEDIENLPEETLDETSERVENRSIRFSYWVWKTLCDDIERLEQWRDLIIHELSDLKMQIRFGIGYVGQQDDHFSLLFRENELIVFLNDNAEPTELTAQHIALHIAESMQAKKVA